MKRKTKQVRLPAEQADEIERIVNAAAKTKLTVSANSVAVLAVGLGLPLAAQHLVRKATK